LNCAFDNGGHGSHCAGSAAGTSYGVAPAATIRSVKVLGDGGSGSWSWSYAALDWLDISGLRPAVASMSLGGSGTQAGMKTAVDAAVAAGVIVVVAGGNDNADACSFSPAFIASAITVGSTNQTDTRSSFSNYGSCTNIWAPGHNIKSVGIASDTASQTFSGTSMACPHVSGGVALLLENNANLNSADALSTLLERSVVGAVKDLKCGDVNFLLWVGAGDAQQPDSAQPDPVCLPTNFMCASGCQIKFGWVNDNYCDCPGCEDEDSHSCDTCECPTTCGEYGACGR